MRILGPETADERELREWFESQERGNIERLEAGAQTIIQLVTGLYGVLSAVLALSDQPAYLHNPIVQWAGTVGVCAFFGSLLAAMLVAIPRRVVYQKDNLTEMQRMYGRLQRRKATLLRTAQIVFLIGTACLVTVILAILWKV
jgi:Trk-type K+ transport system membrane component